MQINIERVCAEVESRLGGLERCGVKLHYKDPDIGATYMVDGSQCISSVSFWLNGLCDCEHVIVATEKRAFTHYEFESEEQAVSSVVYELEAAIGRA